MRAIHWIDPRIAGDPPAVTPVGGAVGIAPDRAAEEVEKLKGRRSPEMHSSTEVRAHLVDAEPRFWPKVDRSGGDGACWIWTASKNNTGYGWFAADWRRNSLAHRYSFELLIGPIPDGLVLDHLCRTPSCVNPDHLEPVTPKVNSLRGIGFASENAAKTHCPNGHEYADDNLLIRPRGGRRCRACNRDEARERMRQKRAASRAVAA